MKFRQVHRLKRAFWSLIWLASLGSSLASFPALGYEYKTCFGINSVWGDDTNAFEASPVSFPSTSPFRSALNGAAAGWNSHTPGGEFGFDISYVTSSSYRMGNGINNILFTFDHDWGPATLGVARTRRALCLWPWSVSRIREVDILFNPSFSWSPDRHPIPPIMNDPTNFTIVALHEMGHTLGLQHENDVMGTMSETYPGGGTLGNNNDVHPHADEAVGVRAGYGSSGVHRDLAASTFRPTGTSTTDVIPRRATAYYGIPQSYPFTIENRGTQREENMRVEFFFSDNRYITKFDHYLGAATFDLDPGATPTMMVDITVPTAIPPGDYYFGYVIDPDQQAAETDEWNNGVAHHKPTKLVAAAPPNQAPTACFTTTPQIGSAPLLVTLDASCSTDSDGTISNYSWDFGDGATGSGRNRSHVFDDSGDFAIRLTVEDDDGATGESGGSVYVWCREGRRCEEGR